MQDRIFKRLNKIRKENPKFNEEMVDMFAEKMPDLLDIMIDGKDFDCHINTKEVALLAAPFIKNNKGEVIGFYWDYDTVINAVKSYVDFDEVDFYPADIFVWANVKYGDMAHITSETSIILKTALSELMDEDYPFCEPSQRAYFWLKKNIENNS